MKKLLMAAVAAAALSATPAFATATGQASQDYAVTGTVASQCGGLSAGSVAFGTIATQANGTVTSGSSTSGASSAAAFCNTASTINFTHDDMTADHTHTGATGYTDTLTYTPVVKVNGSAVATGASFTSGSIDVSATGLSSGGNIPFADSYTGKITVTLTPGS
jgi:hypothetical protein